MHAARHGDLGVRGDDRDVDAVRAWVGGPGRGGGGAREVRGDGVQAVERGDAGRGAVGAAVGGGWRVVGGRLSRGRRGEALLLGVVVVVVMVVMLGGLLLGVVMRVLLRRMRLALGMICGVDVGERVRGHLALLLSRGWIGGRQEEGVLRLSVQKRDVDT